MSTTERGRVAEKLAANYLEQRGFQIVARNWQTRWQEVDIIARAGETIHIVEVKYRSNAQYGGGFEYINHDKLERLRQAALFWQTQNHHTGPIQIDAIAVTGELTRPIIDCLPNIAG